MKKLITSILLAFTIGMYANAQNPCDVPIVVSTSWEEGFEGGVMPDCWTMQRISGATHYWRVLASNSAEAPAPEPRTGRGNFKVVLGGRSANNSNVRLVSPMLDLTELQAPTLAFWHVQRARFGVSNNLKVEYSTSIDGPWTTIESFTDEVFNWTEREVVLPASVSSAPVFIAFNGNLGAGGEGLQLDDIRIFDFSGIVEASLLSITEPVPGIHTNLTTTEQVSVVISNTGSDPLENFELSLYLNGEHITTETYTGVPIPINDEISFTFDHRLDLSGAREHTITVNLIIEDNQSIDTTRAITLRNCHTISQFPMVESFEDIGSLPVCWINQRLRGGFDWQVVSATTGTPNTAPEGSGKMALIGFGVQTGEAKLITPQMDLTSLIEPTLKFYHAQAGNLSVYYATSNAGPWTSLQSYEDPVPQWTARSIELPRLSVVYVAFLGEYFGLNGVQLDYVRVLEGFDTCAPFTNFPFTENFSDPVFPPECWNIQSIQGDETWTRVPQATGFSARHGFRTAAQETWLTMAPIALPQTGIFVLEFQSLIEEPAHYGSSEIMISTQGNNPAIHEFQQLYILQAGRDFDANENWHSISIPLTAYMGQTIHIAFRYTGADAHAWTIRDVSVREASATGDMIRLKVRIPEHGSRRVSFGASAIRNESYTVIWGDGTYTVYPAEGFFPAFSGQHEFQDYGDFYVTIFGNSPNATISSINFTGENIQVVEFDLTHAYNLAFFTARLMRYLTSLDLTPAQKLEEVSLSSGSIKNLNVTNLPNLRWISVANNLLESIDLSGLPNLGGVDVSNNNLSEIIWDDRTNMDFIGLWESNALPLEMMFRLREAGITAMFGNQRSANREVSVGTPISLALDTVIVNGITTTIRGFGYSWGSNPDDYFIISGDEVIFLQDGYFEIVLTHSGLPSGNVLITEYVIPFLAGNVHTETITLTIDAGYVAFSVRSTSGIAPINVDFGDGSRVFHRRQGVGHFQHHFRHSANEWPVTISVIGGEFYLFQMTDTYGINRGLLSADFSEAESLEMLVLHNQQNLKTLDLSNSTALEFIQILNSGLNDINISGLPNLEVVLLNHNQLTSFDLSNLPALAEVQLMNNQLTELIFGTAEFTETPEFRYDFSQNSLSLPEIRRALQHLPSGGSFQEQKFRRTTDISVPNNLNADTVLINGIQTNIAVSSIMDISEGEDYTISGNIITFLTDGVFVVTLTHPNLPNSSVEITYLVGNVSEEIISFEFTGTGFMLSFNTSSDQGTVSIDWGDGAVTTHTGSTRYRNIRHPNFVFPEEGTYTVTITIEAGFHITMFQANDWNMSSIDVSQARGLQTLDVPFNNLRHLDVSHRRNLETLFVSDNQLESIDFTGCVNLRLINAASNNLTQIDLTSLQSLERINFADNSLTEIDVTGLTNLHEVQAANNFLSLSRIHEIAQVLANYDGETTASFINQTREMRSYNVGAPIDKASEFLRIGDIAQTVSVTTLSGDVVEQGVAFTVSENGITFMLPGDYIVTLTHSAIPHDHDVNIEFAIEGDTSIQIHESEEFIVFPNPVTDVLNIETTQTIIKIEMVDLTGRVIQTWHGNRKSINVQSIPIGNYILRIHTENAIIPVRVVKK